VLIEMLPPLDSTRWARDQVRECSDEVRALMKAKLEELDARVKGPRGCSQASCGCHSAAEEQK